MSGSDDSLRRLLVDAVRLAPGWTALSIVLTASGAALALALPDVLGRAVGAALAGRPGHGPLVTLGLVLAGSVVTEASATWVNAAGRRAIEVPLRERFTAHVLAVGPPVTRRFGVGDLASRMVGGARDAAGIVPSVLAPLSALVMSAGGVIALWTIDWRLVVVFFLWVPPVVLLVRRLLRRSTELFATYQRLQGELADRFVEAIAGARTIRASGTTAREIERVLVPLPELAATGHATWEAQRRANWTMSLVTPLVEIVLLAVAGLSVDAGRMTAGTWIAVAGYVAVALRFLEAIDPLLDLAHVRAGAGRLAEVLAVARPATGHQPSAPGTGTLTLHDVTVHVDGRPMLDRVSLRIDGGATVAVVGASGTGKSTLAAVTGGLLVPDRGEVCLDGVSLAALAPTGLRRRMAYAFERPVLLGATVHDAIAYAAPGATRGQVVAAARAAAADAFVSRLPGGYDTPIADLRLSGGEIQRLGLARAVLPEPAILILDDATSSLDTVTESQVTAALTGPGSGRTRILIAHRAATAARADVVVWLADGRVRAVAPHARLCREPAYRALFGLAAEDREPAWPTAR
jgi:ATP-binding cassette, subfamily B, bacterial